MKKIGVIGAGVMGRGVTQCFAQYGYPVVLVDLNADILEQARTEIYNNLRLQAMLKREQKVIPQEVVERITFTEEYQELHNMDFIIENVPEQWELKREVYEKLKSIIGEDAIIMVNTSCISITQIGALMTKPEKVIGTHFMNPVPLKDAIEVIKGYHTSENTLSETIELLKTAGKRSIVVEDYPGFVSNRISHLFMNEAAYVVQDQVASPQDVDDIFVNCFGHTMGPLQTADLIGLDTVVDSLNILYETYQDSKFRCCPLLKKMVNAGLLGRKSGKGFYEYYI